MHTIPIDQQVLLHTEALCPSVAIGAITRPAQLWLFFTLTLHLRQLCQLILCSTEGPSLFPDSWGINNKAVLQNCKQIL